MKIAIFHLALRLVLGLLIISSATAQTSLQKVVYINGVHNTRQQADDSRRLIAKVLRESSNRVGDAKRNFTVKGVWNPKGFSESVVPIPECPSECQDLMELFVLKAAEEDYDSSFRKILAPHNVSSVIDVNAAKEVRKYADSLVLGANSALSKGIVNAERMAGTKKALDRLTEYFREPSTTIVVAHSQGNLLANLAWASAASEMGQAIRKQVRIVNVANTTRFAVNNLNLTHSDDNVLAALKFLPAFYNFTRSTPVCAGGVCELQLAPPTFVGATSFSCLLLGCKHAVATYLSTDDIPNTLVTQGVDFTLGKTRFVDRFEDFVYAAISSLELEGVPTPIPTQYTITPLGDVLPFAINDRGDIVGLCGRVACIRLINEQTWRSLGTLGGTFSVAFGINTGGQVVGHSLMQNGAQHAFRYSGVTGSKLEDITPLLNAVWTGASAGLSIKDNGVIIGNITRFDPQLQIQQRAFLLKDGVAHDLGALPGRSYSVALGGNDSGLVVGYSYTQYELSSAFIYSHVTRSMTEIGPLVGLRSAASKVNNAGVVIGNYWPNPHSQDQDSFVYFRNIQTNTETFAVIGPPGSKANGINDRGEVVGITNSGAFVYKNQTLRNLNQLIPMNSGWDLGEAFDINNLGQIIGVGSLNGESQAFLLTPVIGTTTIVEIAP